ncbi:MAG: hypothetical protein MK108_04215 [Mariniblastus sp.]|nr:hypothetical protein [Mariniblastus sp.]
MDPLQEGSDWAESLDQFVEAETAPAPYVTGWKPDVNDHKAMVRAEFVGKPLLCWKLAQLIIDIRRESDTARLASQVDLFLQVTERYTEPLMENLSSRWIVSVLNTYADHAKVEQGKDAALIVTTFMDMLKLADSAWLLDEQPGQDLASYQQNWPHHLGDGMTSYHMQHGNLVANLLKRIDQAVSPHHVTRHAWRTLLQRLRQHENLLTRLAQLNEEFWGDPLDQARRQNGPRVERDIESGQKK